MADAFSTISKPIRPDSFMTKVGRAFTGFGEGYAGRGQEYLDSLRAERERKNAQLTDASVKDAMGVKRALESNNPQEAIAVLVDRANILERMGEDSSDTLALRDLIVNNNIPSAMSEVDSFLSAAQRRGLIAAPAPIPSSQITTGPSGEMGVVTQDPTTREYGFTTISGMADKPFDQTDMRVSDGRYISGPYIGMSPQRVAELVQTGVIEKIGDPLPSTATQPRPVVSQQQVRPPLRMPDQALAQTPAQTAAPAQTTAPAQPAQYVDDPNLTSQENAFRRQEFIDEAAERTRAEEEAQRQRNEEARRVAQEGRAVATAQQEQEEAQEKRTLAKNEMLMALGVLQGRLLNTNVYGDSVYNAATGPIEGRGDSASYLSMIPGGASMQQVQNFVDDFNNLNNLLTVGNLGRMSGVLSESDIKLIRDAASGLQRTSDPELLKTRMRVIEGIILNRLKEQFGMSEQEIRQQLPQFSTASGSELDRLMEEAGVASGLN